jgi:hypothetical protein
MYKNLRQEIGNGRENLWDSCYIMQSVLKLFVEHNIVEFQLYWNDIVCKNPTHTHTLSQTQTHKKIFALLPELQM